MKQAGRVSDAPPLLILIWFILILILIIPMKQAGRVSSGTSLFDPLLNSLHPTQLGLIVMRRIWKRVFSQSNQVQVQVQERKLFSLQGLLLLLP